MVKMVTVDVLQSLLKHVESMHASPCVSELNVQGNDTDVFGNAIPESQLSLTIAIGTTKH